MKPLPDVVLVVLIGTGATVLLDLWLTVLRRLGARTLAFALVGRWVGHLARGTFTHEDIARAPPVRAELALGWVTHYAVGIAFAALLVAIEGIGWVRQPSLLPAIGVGTGTAVAPLFVMQPAMGAGFAASKTKAPVANSLRSVVSHAVFGAGLYLTAAVLAWMSP